MKRFLLNWWTISLATAAIVALLLVLALPLLVHVLRPWWVRLLMLALVAAVWGALAGWRILRARRAARQLGAALAQTDPADTEAATVARRMTEALASLRSSSGKRRDYLYSRPWYVIIGPPGAGKTTALQRSGLRFPATDTALKGAGGTRNLDFLFADEAVLVDTAGRYTSQDSHARSDAAAWASFLKLLRKHRPLQPINGVLVAIGVDELLTADLAKLDEHASTVRRRLAEISDGLELSAPVYVLFTKADLLAGFSEYFEDLDAEGRRAVLGATLPVAARGSLAGFAAAYDGFAQGVSDRLAKRLQEEQDAGRRAAILGFPSQIHAVRRRVLRFLDGLTPENSEGARVRGFYLTSGVQDGTPLDRILGGMAAAYSQRVSPSEGKGRAYFLNRLLTEVVIPEAGLVRQDPAAERRRRLQLVAGLAAIGAVSVLVLVLWTISFVSNRNLQAAMLASAQNARREQATLGLQLVEVRRSDPTLEESLGYLRALRELPGGYADRRRPRPIFQRLGLYQGGLSRAAEQAYLESLQRVMLPRLLLRLEDQLEARASDPLAVYDGLKAYLILGGRSPKPEPRTVAEWIKTDWETESLTGPDRAGTRKELGQHLEAMLGDRRLGAVWAGGKAPLDGDRVASAQASVRSLSLADRGYALLRQRNMTTGWSASTKLSAGDALAFANGDSVLQATVPYFFTKAGYERAYLPGLQTIQGDLERELWVLGKDADTEAVRAEAGGIRTGVAAAYAREYIATWEKIAQLPQPASYFRETNALNTLTKQPSPLKLLLLEVRKNTIFSTGVAAAAQKKVTGMAGGAAAAALAGAGGFDAGSNIQAHFKPLHDYVGDGKAPGQLEAFLGALKSAGAATQTANVLGGGMGSEAAQAQLGMAVGNLSVSAGAPLQLQGFMQQALAGGISETGDVRRRAVSDAYDKQLATACRGTLTDRYPFFGAAKADASVTDIQRVFGLNGQFDAFTRGALAPLLDRTGPIWRWRADDPVAAALNPTSAEQFQKAANLQDLLAAGLPLKVEVAAFGGGVTAVEFAASGATYRFEPANLSPRPVMWSLSGVPEAHVTLFNGAKEVRRFEQQGPWALFRLMDQARKENAGPTVVRATFGEGAASVSLRVTLPSDRNPFNRSGLWSLRCPVAL